MLQRVARGSGRWTELTLDGLNKLMILVEERLFPGDELAAAMASAAAAAVAAGSTTSATDNDGANSGDATSGIEKDGRGSPTTTKALMSEMEGGWGEDGTASGSLSHLVECMLEVRNVGGDREWWVSTLEK